MPLPVLIIQNDETDTPGSVTDVLLSRGVGYDIVHVYDNQPMPTDLTDYSGLFVMGGHQGVYEAYKYPYLNEEMALMRTAIAAKKPVLGICLGAQLLAGAFGARVFPNTAQEIGWTPIKLTEAGISDPLFEGLGSELTLLEWHGDTFDMPSGAQLLASSNFCSNQAIKVGESAYGIQFHLEVKQDNIDILMHLYAKSMEKIGLTPEALSAGNDKHLSRMIELANIVFGRWIDLLN